MFDASAFFGVWAFRNTTAHSLHEVCAQLAQHGIQGAAISPVEALLQPEPMSVNRQLLQPGITTDATVAISPVPIINPTLPTWQEHLQECISLANGRLKAVKLAPSYHGYDLNSPQLHDLAGILVDNGLTLCLQLRMEDERTRHSIAFVPPIPLADITIFATQHLHLDIMVCAPYMGELKALSAAPNVSAEMSFVESGHLLRDALQSLGSTRLLVGTHAPIYMPAVGVSKGFADELDPITQNLICSGNYERLFT